MKKILFVAAIAAMTFTSCKKDDDDSNTDCFDCTAAGVTSEICHTDGEDFYTISSGGQSYDQTIPDGTTWDEYKESLEAVCDQ